MITVAIAEDHQSLIDGVQLLLKYEDDISIVGKANDGEELLAIVRRKHLKWCLWISECLKLMVLRPLISSKKISQYQNNCLFYV